MRRFILLALVIALPLAGCKSSMHAAEAPDRVFDLSECIDSTHLVDPASCNGVAVGQFDGAGWLELATIEANARKVRIWKWPDVVSASSPMTLAQTVSLRGKPVAILAGRFVTGAAHDDLVVITRDPFYFDHEALLLRSDGAGVFGAPVHVAAISMTPICATVFGNDAAVFAPRHVAVGCSGEIAFLRNDGEGGGTSEDPRRWTSTVVYLGASDAPSNPTGVGAGDLDNDKDLEVKDEVAAIGVDLGGGGFLAIFDHVDASAWSFIEVQRIQAPLGDTTEPDSVVVGNLSGRDLIGPGVHEFCEIAVLADNSHDDDASTALVARVYKNREFAPGTYDWLKFDPVPSVVHTQPGEALGLAAGRVVCDAPGAKPDLTLLYGAGAPALRLLRNDSGEGPLFVDQGATPAASPSCARRVLAVDVNGDLRLDVVTSRHVRLAKPPNAALAPW